MNTDVSPATIEPQSDSSLGSARANAARRLAAISAWIAERVDLMSQEVVLPRTARRYGIHLPTEESRERLFEEARADPEKQMPHWANVWASGVALADYVVTHREAVEGKRVLELGCGLGTTATAAVETGAILTVADYNPLPLTICRYNVLVNTGVATRSLSFNWRHPDPQAMERARAGGGFPLILAADVLYESRDIWPLLHLIDELLTPDGMLWLAEPGRRTAQRFLNTAAEHGWQGDSLTVTEQWPDGSNNPVNMYFLRRATYVDPLPASLAGWRS